MTFRERFLRGDCSMDMIDDLAQFWHTSPISGQTIQDFLGLSNEEYQIWIAGGKRALAEKLTALMERKYLAFHLEWDDLGAQLESLVQRLLPIPCGVTIKRMDYYFWEMSLDISADVDESLSAEICERLKLQTVELDHFVDGDSVDSNQMLTLLEQLTHHEVSSSHADDYGVWIICKEYRASSSNYPTRLISGCTSIRDTKQNVSAPTSEMICRAEQCLIDNGIEPDEAETVLQALGYILFDADITQDSRI